MNAGYAAHGRGFSIGFDRERLRQIAQAQDYQLIRLIYVESEQEQQFETALRDTIPIVTRWAANRATAPPASSQLLALGIAFTFATFTVKNPHFRDEKEWRLAHLVIPGLSDGQARTRQTINGELPYEENRAGERVRTAPRMPNVAGGRTNRAEVDVTRR